MNHGIKNILSIVGASLLAAFLLPSCNSGYKNADLTVVDFPVYDSTKFDQPDQPSEKCSTFFQ
jgi:hypothetical protein